MTTRIEPAIAADERTTLTQFLDYYRDTLALKVEGLTDEQARLAAVEPSDLSLMGLIRHMAEVERNWFRRRFAGTDAPPLYYGESHRTGDEDGDLHPGPDDTLAEAMLAWQAEIVFAREVTEAASLDDLSARPLHDLGPVSLRWTLVHLIEEYARHCGHADLLRERIDGVTGD